MRYLLMRVVNRALWGYCIALSIGSFVGIAYCQAIDTLDGAWDDVRRRLLAAGGLKEDRSTGHAFNDHLDDFVAKV